MAALKQDVGYVTVLNHLWDDVVLRNMYITLGIGSSHHNEGFRRITIYPTTRLIAKPALRWEWSSGTRRMNRFSNDSKYIEVMERSMYKGRWQVYH
ncbi:hypothetical protein EZS27_032235 [termite gut metagenome]|uniref:Non-reducing end beta-L-arabinofuranosidase-like GH127 catalytic domain-containing protein n=1 Tax=termite gut metagenome TaxID=433724 RepID=A0A5J4Q9E1_9ZZZZ